MHVSASIWLGLLGYAILSLIAYPLRKVAIVRALFAVSVGMLRCTFALIAID
jgi:hypothetical protein